MIEVKSPNKALNIVMTAVPMGNDWSVSIAGGDIPHLGAIGLGIPRQSLKGNGSISATVSVLTLTGHKEDELVRSAAHMIASKLNSSVVVSCGIHVKRISEEYLNLINKTVMDLTEVLIENIIQFKKNNNNA